MPSNTDQSRVLIRAESDKHSDNALEFERLGQFENALAAYELALTVDPTHAAVWSNKGSFLAERRRLEEALDCFDRAIDFEPENVAYWWNKAVTLQDVNRPVESLVSWRRVVAIDPNRSAAWRQIGYCLFDLERYDEAVEAFNSELKRNPRDECLLRKGIALKRLGQIEESIACYDKCLNLAPDDPVVWKNKAIALLALERYEEVIVCCDSGLCSGPTIYRADLLNDKGVALRALKRFSEALNCHDRALALYPKHALNLRNRVAVLRELGKCDEAIPSDERASH